MNGKFGLGFTQTLGGVSAMSFRYWVTRDVALEIDFGLSFLDSSGVRTSTEFLGAFGVMYALVQHRTANLMIGLRGDIGFRSQPPTSGSVNVTSAANSQSASAIAETDTSLVQFNLEIPLIVEYFFSDSFSINLAVGVVLIFVPEGGTILDSTGLGVIDADTDFAVGVGTGGLLGSAGFTFYF
ncbi:MAG: hypothetical protein ACI9OJ_000055 [Myxococcota bacterium]|jgi:hypothetical protein